MAKLEGTKTHQQPEGGLRRRVAGEPPLPLLRARSPTSKACPDVAGTLQGHGGRRDRPRPRSPGLPEAGRRSGHRTSPLARRRRTSWPPSPVRPTSTRPCTRAWRRPRAKRASTTSPSGSRRSPRPRRATPVASQKALDRARRLSRGLGSRSEARGSAPVAQSAAPSCYDETRHEPACPAPAACAPASRSNDPRYWDDRDLEDELRRIFQICHECRMCVTFCGIVPDLFDAVDRDIESRPRRGRRDARRGDLSVGHRPSAGSASSAYIKCPYTEDEGARGAARLPAPDGQREKAQRARRDGIAHRRPRARRAAAGRAGRAPVAARPANLVNAKRLVRKVHGS